MASLHQKTELSITLLATSPVASEMDLGTSEKDQSSGGRLYNCPIGQYMMSCDPKHKSCPEDSFWLCSGAQGITSDIDEPWKLYVEQAHRLVDQLNSQPPLAGKPGEGDKSVMYYDIPDSENLAIRLWDGNMQKYGLYCLDLYDTFKRIAVNLPDGYKFCTVPHPGTFVVGGTGSDVKSWEVAYGLQPEEVLPREERFVVPEGWHLALVRGGR